MQHQLPTTSPPKKTWPWDGCSFLVDCFSAPVNAYLAGKRKGIQNMSVEGITANGVTNQRHLRYGASTLIRDKIYPADLTFYRRQIVREDIPRPEVPDVPVPSRPAGRLNREQLVIKRCRSFFD